MPSTFLAWAMFAYFTIGAAGGLVSAARRLWKLIREV